MSILEGGVHEGVQLGRRAAASWTYSWILPTHSALCSGSKAKAATFARHHALALSQPPDWRFPSSTHTTPIPHPYPAPAGLAHTKTLVCDPGVPETELGLTASLTNNGATGLGRWRERSVTTRRGFASDTRLRSTTARGGRGCS